MCGFPSSPLLPPPPSPLLCAAAHLTPPPVPNRQNVIARMAPEMANSSAAATLAQELVDAVRDFPELADETNAENQTMFLENYGSCPTVPPRPRPSSVADLNPCDFEVGEQGGRGGRVGSDVAKLSLEVGERARRAAACGLAPACAPHRAHPAQPIPILHSRPRLSPAHARCWPRAVLNNSVFLLFLLPSPRGVGAWLPR